jgi:hypothetical protein
MKLAEAADWGLEQMKSKAGRNLAMVAISAVAFFVALPGHAQFAPLGGGQLGSVPGTRPQNDVDGAVERNPNWSQDRLRLLNAERHKSMVSDSEKLLKLARQLDAEIASNSTDELTPEELHKVGEIEKLARSVKAKMAQSFGGGPEVRPSAIPLGGPGR